MIEYVHVWAEYETKDHNGQTKRARGKYSKTPLPQLTSPDGFEHVIAWFWELRSFCNGHENPVTPSMIKDWRDLQGVLISPWEADTLFRMDRVFRATLAKEVANNEERRRASEARKAKR